MHAVVYVCVCVVGLHDETGYRKKHKKAGPPESTVSSKKDLIFF